MKTLEFTLTNAEVALHHDALEAVVLVLAEKVQGWNTWDVVDGKTRFNGLHKHYMIDLDTVYAHTIGTFEVSVMPDGVQVSGEYDVMVKVDDQWKDYEMLVSYMDDEIREYLHSKLVPCSEQEFIDAYVLEHEKKYGELFEVN